MPKSYVRRYEKAHYDRVVLMIPIGKKEILKQMAKDEGARSFSGWLLQMIEDRTGVELVLRGELPTLKK